MLRDLVSLRGQAAAIGLVIAAGVATFVMSMCAYKSLEATKDRFYADYLFADAHGFIPGDQVRAIINGKVQSLSIVGIALSPEYVIQVQPGSILPDDKRFGIFWVSDNDLEAAFDMAGAFNNVSI